MREYYILKGKDQFGPYRVDELQSQGVTAETLVWCEGMEDWQKAKDVPELAGHLKTKAVPPPPPMGVVEQTSRTEVSGHLTVTSHRSPAKWEGLMQHRKLLLVLVVWCSFHLFAVLMSTSRVEIFNNQGKPRTNKFWPFVEFVHEDQVVVDRPIWEGGGFSKRVEKVSSGFFVEYDWTEFTFYTLGGILGVVVFRLARGRRREAVNGK